ncbi:PAS domain-containing sensor histidine kinase [Gorillibacterium massiliense]|uniref:PAS domain-containing sensor histidine kinase n=1 Tax=Gorillibacterium massiliense TaxID=1280390 RepID=UPI0004B7CF3D|nr:PAS domain-containing sensor histidine kinase [Gorillibacterium massiliense]
MVVFLKSTYPFDRTVLINAFKCASIGMAVLSLKGHWLNVNPAFCRILGYTEEELLELNFADITHPDDLTSDLDMFNRLITGELQKYELEKRYIHKTGRILQIALSVSIVLNKFQTPLYVITQVQDITERKREERERTAALVNQLKSSRESFLILLNQVPDAAIILDDAVCVYANEAASAFLGGGNPDFLPGRSIYDIVLPSHHQAVKEHLANQQVSIWSQSSIEYRVTGYAGEEYDVEALAFPVLFNDRPAVNLLLRDMAEHKLSRSALIESEKLSTVGLLSAGIAHEIRNPLTSLKGFLKLLRTQVENYRYISIMESELERIESTVNELLFLAKPKLQSYSSVEIFQLLTEVILFLEPHAHLLDVIITGPPASEERYVWGDRNHLKQVFLNLIKNGMEASPSGGQLTLNASVADGWIKVTVSDQGSGIPKEIRNKLGQPFVSTKENGNGLGLMICHNIVKNHNGSLLITSGKELGTQATVALPLYQPSAS